MEGYLCQKCQKRSPVAGADAMLRWLQEHTCKPKTFQMSKQVTLESAKSGIEHLKAIGKVK